MSADHQVWFLDIYEIRDPSVQTLDAWKAVASRFREICKDAERQGFTNIVSIKDLDTKRVPYVIVTFAKPRRAEPVYMSVGEIRTAQELSDLKAAHSQLQIDHAALQKHTDGLVSELAKLNAQIKDLANLRLREVDELRVHLKAAAAGAYFKPEEKATDASEQNNWWY